jgi:hypothetical protein
VKVAATAANVLQISIGCQLTPGKEKIPLNQQPQTLQAVRYQTLVGHVPWCHQYGTGLPRGSLQSDIFQRLQPVARSWVFASQLGQFVIGQLFLSLGNEHNQFRMETLGKPGSQCQPTLRFR